MSLSNRSSQVSTNGDTLTYTNCKNVTITLPRRKMGPSSDTHDKIVTTNILTSNLTKIDEEIGADIGLSIDPLEHWCLVDYLECLLEAICQVYQAVSNEDRRIRTMVFCTDNDEHLFAAGAYINTYLNRHKIGIYKHLLVQNHVSYKNEADHDLYTSRFKNGCSTNSVSLRLVLTCLFDARLIFDIIKCLLVTFQELSVRNTFLTCACN